MGKPTYRLPISTTQLSPELTAKIDPALELFADHMINILEGHVDSRLIDPVRSRSVFKETFVKSLGPYLDEILQHPYTPSWDPTQTHYALPELDDGTNFENYPEDLFSYLFHSSNYRHEEDLEDSIREAIQCALRAIKGVW